MKYLAILLVVFLIVSCSNDNHSLLNQDDNWITSDNGVLLTKSHYDNGVIVKTNRIMVYNNYQVVIGTAYRNEYSFPKNIVRWSDKGPVFDTIWYNFSDTTFIRSIQKL